MTTAKLPESSLPKPSDPLQYHIKFEHIHYYVPFEFVAMHTRCITNDGSYSLMDQLYGMLTTKVKCIMCGDVMEMPLTPEEKKLIGM